MADIFDLIAEGKKEQFDPEGSGYDYENAIRAGIKPETNPEDGLPHWASRDPNTGLLLKGRNHPSFQTAVEEDQKLGYQIYKRGNRYYSLKGDIFDAIQQTQPKVPTVQEVLHGRKQAREAIVKSAEEKQLQKETEAWDLSKFRATGAGGFSLAGQGTSGGVSRVVTPPPATFREKVDAVYQAPGPLEAKRAQTSALIQEEFKNDFDELTRFSQDATRRKEFIEEAEKQRARFASKTWNRLERGMVNQVGGGLHLAEELTRIVTLGKYGDSLADQAKMYSDVLNEPAFQPVVDNWFDKWIGGGVESAPFFATTLLPGGAAKLLAGTKYAAAAVSMARASSFLTTYGVESNMVYQELKRSGYSDNEARVRSVLAGLLNAGIELRGGSGEKYFVQNVIDASTKKLGKWKYFGRKALTTALTEGLAEELPQEAVSMILGDSVPKLPNGKVDWSKAASRLIDAGIMGTAMGGLIAAPIVGYEAYSIPAWSQAEQVPVSAEAVALPGRTYAEAKIRAEDGTNGKNPWVKMESTRTNKDRVLLVQFASDLLTAGTEDPAAKAYYDKLYANRPGYVRLGDTWEIPKWITEAANFVPGADVYFVRDMAEARRFLKSSGYQKLMMSVLDINTAFIQQLINGYEGKVVLGGYTGGKALAGAKNVTWYNSMPDMAKGEGYEYKPGVNLDHFEGSPVMPRLCMSKGCKHRCAFCVVPHGKIEEVAGDLVKQQVDAFGKLDAKFIYLDDKTFGQAENHTMLPDLYWRIKNKNPEFDGFIVQTTAAQFNKFSDEFLSNAHIRYVEFGVESYNNDILGKLKKPHNTAMIDAASEKARRLKMNLIPNIIIGVPWETEETYANTLDYLDRNADIISHVNAYNLEIYDNADIKKAIYGDENAVVPPEDLNENAVAKSFHKNPEVVQKFAAAVYAFSDAMLDHPPISEDLTVDQEVAAKYGVTPGQVTVLLNKAEDRYRELKAKPTSERKGKPERVRKVVRDVTTPEKREAVVEFVQVDKDESVKPVVPEGLADLSWEFGKAYWRLRLGFNRRQGRLPVEFWNWYDKVGKKGAKEAGVAVVAKPDGQKFAYLTDKNHPVIEPARKTAAKTVVTPATTKRRRVEEVTPATGEHAELAFLSRYRNDVEALLGDITSKDPVTTLKLVEKTTSTARPVPELRAMGHDIPQQLGMTEEERRALMTEVTGKDSMKKMNAGEMEQYVQFLEAMLKDAGQKYEPKEAVYYEMMDQMQNQEHPQDILTASLEKGKGVQGFFKQVWDDLAKGAWDMAHIDRLCEYLDGGVTNGVFKRFFWRPAEASHIAANDGYNMDVTNMDEFTHTLGIKPWEYISKRQRVNARLNMTAGQRMGVYMLAMNEKGKQRLAAIGFTPKDIQNIYEFMGGPDGNETKMAEYFLKYYENMWPILFRKGIEVGLDEETLKQEFMHSPILYTDKPADQQGGILDYFDESNFPLAGTKPEQGMLKERVKKVTGRPMELDAFAIFFHAANQYNRFIHMSTVVRKMNQLLGDKKFSVALDAATHGQGTDLITQWLKHTVRGHGDSTNKTMWRMIASLRDSAIVYAMGWNQLSVVRQVLQLFNVAGMDVRMLGELPKTIIGSLTGSYADMRKEVFEKSGTVRNRHMEEVARKAFGSKALARRYSRKIDMDKVSMAELTHFDERTVVVSWKAAYDIAVKYGLPDPVTRERKAMSEEEARSFADEVVSKNQSMADAIYMPDVMRTGPMNAIYKMLMPFTNQVNNNLNLYVRDNLDPVRTAGVKKGGPAAAYRYLFTLFLPAMFFGMIRRGRLQRNPREVFTDLATYPVAGILLVSDWITSLVEGAGMTTGMYESGLDSSAKLAKGVLDAAKADTPEKRAKAQRAIVKNAARTIALVGGAKFPGLRGVITAQTVRSAEAGYDMAMGNKEAGVRRFIYGNYTFEQYNKEKREEEEIPR